VAYDPHVAFPFPPGVSGLIDPDDESFIALLELCATARRNLGLPSYTRADLERLVALKDIILEPGPLPPNVLPLKPARSSRVRRLPKR
jgi:hypothetical protein